MTTAELKEYFAMVVQTEKEVDLQERLYRKVNSEIDGYECNINSLKETILDREELSKPKYKRKSVKNAILTGILWSIVIGFFWQNGAELLGGIAEIILWGYILCGISSKEEKNRKLYEETLKVYEAHLAEAKKEKSRVQEQVEKLTIQKQTAEACRKKIETSLASSRRNLEKMYSYNIVFPKYRNYVMVSSIYEYLCAGRCTTLEGHEGAYNILELEIRLDRIITRLDDILRNLAAIQANQYTLYSCLQDSNQKIDMLLREESRMADGILRLGTQASAANARLESLQRSSELTNYLTECNQRELHYMNRMNYLAGHYDNPYGNYTPV